MDALPDATALVAYARFATRPDGVERYVAFAAAGGGQAPHMVPLGEAAMIDSLVARWRREAGSPLTSRDDAERDRACRAAGSRLREVVWDPIFSRINAPRHVLLVPDGALVLVNFGALPLGDSEYVIERDPVLHVLSAEREVIGAAGHDRSGRGLLALGDPEYDLAPGGGNAPSPSPYSVAASSSVAMASSPEVFRGARAHCPEFDRLRWNRLPGTALEIDEALTLWTARSPAAGAEEVTSSDTREEGLRLVGADATEAAFKTRARGWRILHLATHGFFLGDDCASGAVSTAAVRGIGGYAPGAPAAAADSASAPSNPLQFSGLILAGANKRATTAQGDEDGILTAEEIAALDLSEAEWVVLSACDTGLGRIHAGEGVFGLRRAFQIAGAGATIMSLWPVGDTATREWMRALYEARFVDGLATDEAVRAASLARLDAQRASASSTHPSVWAAFIAAGDWR
jgi:CHAT domain-containing protein